MDEVSVNTKAQVKFVALESFASRCNLTVKKQWEF